jgi:lantibiotic modifying enzyme
MIEAGESENDTFLSGNLGLVLYYYLLFEETGSKERKKKGAKLLENIFEKLNSGEPGIAGPLFSSGGAGLGIVLAFLEKNNWIAEAEKVDTKELDEFLFSSAVQLIENDVMDCLHGAFGILHYFSEKPVNTKQQYIDPLIEKIYARVVKEPTGYWFKNYVLQDAKKQEINFSLSHGLAGMLLLLIKAYDHTKRKDLVQEILKNGIQFIRKHQLYVDFTNSEYSWYPFSIEINAQHIENRARMGWCYGDLGIALLFYRAGKLLNDKSITRSADITGMNCLMREKTESNAVYDSHFCHGSAGVAQFFLALHQESGNSKYLNGYEQWIEKTILFLKTDLENDLYKGKEQNLLDGLIGVSLVLLTYCSEKKTNWSKLLFL